MFAELAHDSKLAWRRALTPNARYTKDSLPDGSVQNLVYWFRQLVAVILGFLWGMSPVMVGMRAILAYLSVSSTLTYVYFDRFLVVAQDDFGGPFGLLKEGFQASTGVFFWMV
ncbi:unnamed protein product, partial [Phaeothamnion confervicola]